MKFEWEWLDDSYLFDNIIIFYLLRKLLYDNQKYLDITRILLYSRNMLNRRYRSASQIDSVIDLEKLRSGPKNCIERDPSQFLELTYLTEDLHKVLRTLCQRFDSSAEAKDSTPGLVLAEGVKGQGKSHALLLTYHLFANSGPAQAWMKSVGYQWNPPADAIVLVEKFTDQYLPLDSLWSYISEKLEVTWTQDHPPSLKEFRETLAGRHLVLIFDELERGITNITDTARLSQNLSFLQMISEEANRSPLVTLIAAFYDGAKEPGATLKRIPRLELRFRNAEDRAAIVRHRLFSNADSYDRKSADSLIQSYVNTWQRMGSRVMDEYTARLRASFPFLPELIDLIFERMGGGDVFQGTRGALGLLGAMLDAAPSQVGLLTGAHCRLTDHACADRLQDLDPSGTTISCAQGNLRELLSQPYAEAIASATLLTSLVPGGRSRGVSKDELIRHVAEPGCDPNQFQATLEAFRRFGSYFHLQEDRYYFDIEENEEAKVELEALRSGSDGGARDQIRNIWLQGLFKDWQQALIYSDQDTTQAMLNGLPKKGPRFVLAPRRLSNPERHALYRGAEQRNQIILLEPRDDGASHMTNRDLLASANRYAAATALSATAKSAERKDRYEKIANRERKATLDALKEGGLVYTRVDRWADPVEDSVFELEPLGAATNREEVVTFIRTQIFPQTYFMEHIRAQLPHLMGQRVEQVDRLYRSTLSYPVPLKEDMVSGAILLLTEDRVGRPLGLQGPRGRSFCGELVDFSATELDEAILAPPWASATVSPPRISPTGPDQPQTKPEELQEPQPSSSFYTPGVRTEERGTPVCRSLGELRQQVAARLSDVAGADIQQVSFRVLANAQDADLSGFNSSLRGALTGKGNLDVQIELTCPGPMTKAEAEARCEKLPTLPQACYSARLQILAKQELPE